MVKSVLLTGANGYIGRHIYAYLKNIGKYEVTVLSRDCSKWKSGRCIALSNLSEENFDFVINCIGETKCDGRMLEANFMVPKNIIDSLNFSRVQKFIHLSTVAVYDQTVSGEINISSRIDLNSEYARTKHAFDSYLFTKGEFHKKIVIVRPSNVSPDKYPSNVISRLSKYRVKFLSLRTVYINWISVEKICERIGKELISEDIVKNEYILNDYMTLNEYNRVFHSSRGLFFIPISVDLCRFLLFLLPSDMSKIKFHQLFSRHYFK